MWYANGNVRILHQQHISMDPLCLVPTVQAGGGGGALGNVLCLGTHGLLNTNQALVKCHSLF